MPECLPGRNGTPENHVAGSWFHVKTRLEEMEDTFISFDTFRSLCREKKVTEKAAQNTLADFLNDLGIILHFKDFKLLDTPVLEPKWVTQAVYKIINSPKLAENKGVLVLDLLDDILAKGKEEDYYYPPEKYPFIIELMMKFELCYGIDDKRVLIPDLLEAQEPEIDFDVENSLKFLLEYDFLPRSVMPRFIVKRHMDIRDELRWRTGVVLQDDAFHAVAVVKADERDKKIFIYVSGEQKRDYFSGIRKTFQDINRSFEKLPVVERVPLPDNREISVEYDELIGHEMTGKDEIFIGRLRKGYPVSKLLDGIEDPVKRKRRGEREEAQLLRKPPAPPPVPKEEWYEKKSWKGVAAVISVLAGVTAIVGGILKFYGVF